MFKVISLGSVFIYLPKNPKSSGEVFCTSLLESLLVFLFEILQSSQQ